MNIQIHREYKSLQPFLSEEFPEFTIITGKNGSGKSQLIQLIREQYINKNEENRISFQPKFLNIQVEGISFQNVQILKSENINRVLETTIHSFLQIPELVKKFISELLVNGLNPIEIDQQFDFTKYMNEKT